MAPFRILALDGGGIRGVLTARLLERLEQAAPGLLASTQLFAGTSTGAILALGLADGRTPAHLRWLYERDADQVFDDSWLDGLLDLGNAAGAEYRSDGLAKLLVGEFGERTLDDLGRRVLVPAFDLEAEVAGRRRWKPKFFHNFPGDDSDGAERLVDVALRSTATPSYFPSYQGYVDGGVVASNPSLAALAQALDARNPAGERPALAEIALLSLGSGEVPRFISGQQNDWGWLHWAKPIIELMLDGSKGVADYQCRQILGERYWRLSPDLPTPIGVDDVDAVQELLDIADQTPISEAAAWLHEHWTVGD